MSNPQPSAVHRQPSRYWLRSGALALLERGFGMLFNFGTAVLLLRMLSKEDFAAWGVFMLVVYFIEVGRSGLLQNGLVRHLAVHRDDRVVCGGIMMASLALNLSYSLISSLLLWTGSDWIARQYQVPQLSAMLPAFLVANFAMVVYNHCYFVQQAYMEFRGVFWSTFFYRGLVFAGVLLCWLGDLPIGLSQLSWALPAGTVVAAVAAWFYARPFLIFFKKIDFQWVVNLLAYGKYVLGTNLSAMFYKNIDKLTLGQLLGPAAFALYDVAGKVTQMIETPSFSVASVVFPQSAARIAREGTAGVKRLYERSVAATLAIILPFLLLLWLFAEPVVWLFAGEQYMESANVLRLTAFFGLFLPFAVQSGTLLDSTGRPAVNFLFTLFTALLNLGLSYWFVQQYGLFGAAFATLAGYSVSFVLIQIYLYKKYKINALNAFFYIPEVYGLAFGMVKKFALRGG